jgi:hypothetical protein
LCISSGSMLCVFLAYAERCVQATLREPNSKRVHLDPERQGL